MSSSSSDSPPQGLNWTVEDEQTPKDKAEDAASQPEDGSVSGLRGLFGQDKAAQLPPAGDAAASASPLDAAAKPALGAADDEDEDAADFGEEPAEDYPEPPAAAFGAAKAADQRRSASAVEPGKDLALGLFRSRDSRPEALAEQPAAETAPEPAAPKTPIALQPKAPEKPAATKPKAPKTPIALQPKAPEKPAATKPKAPEAAVDREPAPPAKPEKKVASRPRRLGPRRGVAKAPGDRSAIDEGARPKPAAVAADASRPSHKQTILGLGARGPSGRSSEPKKPAVQKAPPQPAVPAKAPPVASKAPSEEVRRRFPREDFPTMDADELVRDVEATPSDPASAGPKGEPVPAVPVWAPTAESKPAAEGKPELPSPAPASPSDIAAVPPDKAAEALPQAAEPPEPPPFALAEPAQAPRAPAPEPSAAAPAFSDDLPAQVEPIPPSAAAEPEQPVAAAPAAEEDLPFLDVVPPSPPQPAVGKPSPPPVDQPSPPPALAATMPAIGVQSPTGQPAAVANGVVPQSPQVLPAEAHPPPPSDRRRLFAMSFFALSMVVASGSLLVFLGVLPSPLGPEAESGADSTAGLQESRAEPSTPPQTKPGPSQPPQEAPPEGAPAAAAKPDKAGAQPASSPQPATQPSATTQPPTPPQPEATPGSKPEPAAPAAQPQAAAAPDTPPSKSPQATDPAQASAPGAPQEDMEALQRQSDRSLVSAGNHLLRRGKVQEAEARFRLVLRRDPDEHHAKEGLVRILLKRGDAEQALTMAEQIVKKRPRRASYRVLYGDALGMMGHRAAAREQWREALRYSPTNKDAKRRLSGP